MTTDRELMQQVLDALSMAVEPKKGKVYAFEFQPIDCTAMYLKAIEALRARLAQPEQEWQGLTDQEYKALLQQADYDAAATGSVFQNLRHAIEIKLKTKNNF